MEYKEYRGFKYKLQPKGCWVIQFPSGFKLTTQVITEDELKSEIDKLAEKAQ